MCARLGKKNMQVQGIKSINFSSGRLTPEALEARAMALEDTDGDVFTIRPEKVADVIDGKLRKTKTGRKIINTVVSALGFAGAVVSFKKVAPKLRSGIAAATGRIAGKVGNIGQRINNQNIHEVAGEMTKDAAKIAAKGDGTVIQKTALKILGEQRGAKAIEGLKQVGIETGGDVADTAIAVGAAVLAGREAGDIVDGAQKDLTLKDALKDIAKVASVIPGADVIPQL